MKKSVAKSLVLLAVLIMMANVIACSSTPVKEEIKPTQQNIEATKDYLTYENAAHALKVKYPKDWEKKEEAGIVVGFISPGISNVNLVSEDLSKNPSVKVDEFVKAALPTIEKTFKNFKLIENTPITMGTVKAQKLVYTANAEGLDLKFMQVITIINKKAYAFTYTSTPDDFNKDLATAQNIIDSLTI